MKPSCPFLIPGRMIINSSCPFLIPGRMIINSVFGFKGENTGKRFEDQEE
jgi:zona occludens toxin (predicted ATPase)